MDTGVTPLLAEAVREAGGGGGGQLQPVLMQPLPRLCVKSWRRGGSWGGALAQGLGVGLGVGWHVAFGGGVAGGGGGY